MNQKQIFELIDKFEESRLAELKIESEDFKINLKGAQAEAVPVAVPLPPYPGPAAHAVPQEVPVSETPLHASEGSPAADGGEIISSPIVGTFYRSPAPDAPAFVDEGSAVAAGDSLCIIEAMKIMNKLEADFSCEIVKILADNGQLVEYGAPLFEVKRV